MERIYEVTVEARLTNGAFSDELETRNFTGVAENVREASRRALRLAKRLPPLKRLAGGPRVTAIEDLGPKEF